jgi:hypothetical protein
VAFACTLPIPDLHAAVEAATPLGDIRAERFPGYLRRHHERMERFRACFFS